ncbi:nuclear transport factor 2 family protein [Paracoccaceae bacterium]|nr:nuclear transport factor 2 family protein [Paracoccaceae bacterium]
MMLAKVIHSNKDKKIMALFKKWEEAWNNNDASGWFSLLHEDYQFTFHSSGNVMKKSDMTIEMMTSTMERETITNRRCIYENDDIIVIHQLAEFTSGDKEALMLVNLKKDGLLWRTETGATPIK